METRNLAELYDLPTLAWEPVAARLAAGIPQAPGDGGPDRHTCWLTTLGADGTPHTTAVGANWVDGAWWFQSSRRAVKARNVERDPRCTIAVATAEYDVSVVGRAALVTDPATVARMAQVWVDGGWPCRVEESGTALTAEFSAPSAGPPPWHVYRVEPVSAVAVATTGEGGATRFAF
jgi:hypothetical protein